MVVVYQVVAKDFREVFSLRVLCYVQSARTKKTMDMRRGACEATTFTPCWSGLKQKEQKVKKKKKNDTFFFIEADLLASIKGPVPSSLLLAFARLAVPNRICLPYRRRANTFFVSLFDDTARNTTGMCRALRE